MLETLKRRYACSPPLTAKLAPWMTHLLERPKVSQSLVQNYGSPVHAVVRSEFARNGQDLLAPLKERGIDGGLFFARKANKLKWFVEAAKSADLGIDTASFEEVEESLSSGIPGHKIVVTAIGKNAKLVDLSLQAGCLLVIDNMDELALIAERAKLFDSPCPIGVRFSGFKLKDRVVYSRFGLPVGDCERVFDALAEYPQLQLETLHAHIDRYDPAERAEAGRQLLKLIDRAAAKGFNVKNIDLGGGILLRYLQDHHQWETFNERLHQFVAGQRRSFVATDDGFGLRSSASGVTGTADLYPAWNDLSKERFICAILDDTTGGTALHREFSARGVRLYFEPGRALLDNTGVTLAPVRFRKHDTNGDFLVGLEMNRLNLRPFRAEFCCDPLLVANGEREPLNDGAFIVGNLCSESDLIYRRKLNLPFLPQPDDIFVFPNTAGYLAHHMEIGTHGGMLPKNVLLNDETLEVLDVA